MSTVRSRSSGRELASFRENAMPKLTGIFGSREDWEEFVLARLGGCVDISDEDDDAVSVLAHELGEEVTYTIAETDDGFVVS